MAKPRKKASRRTKRVPSESTTSESPKVLPEGQKHCDSVYCADMDCPNYSVYVDPMFQLPPHSLYLRRLGGGAVCMKALWSGLTFGGRTHVPLVAHLIFDDLAFVKLSADAYVQALEFFAITANGEQMYEVLPPQPNGRHVLGWLDDLAELEEYSDIDECPEDPYVSSTLTSGMRQSDITRPIDYRSFAYGMSEDRMKSMLRILSAS